LSNQNFWGVKLNDPAIDHNSNLTAVAKMFNSMLSYNDSAFFKLSATIPRTRAAVFLGQDCGE
jgi:hypothetical protein